MKIATLLFCYNRSRHLGQVISALKQNTVLPQKLFIFQDGLKRGGDDKEWHKVNRLIRGIEWCDKEIIVSEKNKGLSNSITEGIDYVLKGYDALIVLEDDCVPSPDFLNFMYQCLERYRNTPEVYSVSGYAWPYSLLENGTDIYFCGRISSWGWGTWKNRWISYKKDYTLLKRIRLDSEKVKELSIWGPDLENTLLDNVRGKNDSWAVFWALNVILNRGICVNPYKSLIQNIGHDGTGVHCGSTSGFMVQTDERKNVVFKFPDITAISDLERKAFKGFGESLKGITLEEKQMYYRDCMEKWIAFKQTGQSIGKVLSDKNIKNIAVFGTGKIAKLLVREISEDVETEYFIVTNKSDCDFMGRKVWEVSEKLPEKKGQLTLLVVPGYDMDKIKKRVGEHFQECIPIDSLFGGIRI